MMNLGCSKLYSVLKLFKQYFVFRLPDCYCLWKLHGQGVRLLMIITNALFFKSNEGAGINNIPQYSEQLVLILLPIFRAALA